MKQIYKELLKELEMKIVKTSGFLINHETNSPILHKQMVHIRINEHKCIVFSNTNEMQVNLSEGIIHINKWSSNHNDWIEFSIPVNQI